MNRLFPEFDPCRKGPSKNKKKEFQTKCRDKLHQAASQHFQKNQTKTDSTDGTEEGRQPLGFGEGNWSAVWSLLFIPDLFLGVPLTWNASFAIEAREL